VYDKVIARNIDPIEKKPLFHFQPGSRSFSIATPGCNFRCKHCQNSDISQLPRDRGGMILGEDVSPAVLVEAARRLGCSSISYTYTEPTIFSNLPTMPQFWQSRQVSRTSLLRTGTSRPRRLWSYGPTCMRLILT
jgi:MoaA/NifB/PqqE/SkfB family radical SAM enzyme